MADFNMKLIRNAIFDDDKKTLNVLKKSAVFPLSTGLFYTVKNKNGQGSGYALGDASSNYVVIPTEAPILNDAVDDNFEFKDLTGTSGIRIFKQFESTGDTMYYCIDDGKSLIKLFFVTTKTSGTESTNLINLLYATARADIETGTFTDASCDFYDGEGNTNTTNCTYTTDTSSITIDFSTAQVINTNSGDNKYVCMINIKKKSGYSLNDDKGPVFKYGS